MLEQPPLSLYAHIPWCVRKCPYCDFNSHERDGPLPEAAYIDALCRDLDGEAERLPPGAPRALRSVFIGGGTPSLFGAASIDRLLRHIARRLELPPGTEVTLEANPGAVEAGRFAELAACGVNRLSLGIQSFDDGQLRRLGRIHGASEARAAIDAARRAGFENINLDIMHGLPGQTADQALADLGRALDCGPAHLSWYQLAIEPNTAFRRRPPPLPPEAAVLAMQAAGLRRLEEGGWRRYEVSAWAARGMASAHNLNYWRFGDYLGIGAGACGKLTFPADGRIVRTRKFRRPERYLAGPGFDAGRDEVPRGERALEFLLNALRLRDGFAESEFAARTGLAFDAIAKTVDSLALNGLLARGGGRVAPTRRGYRLLDSLLEAFVGTETAHDGASPAPL